MSLQRKIAIPPTRRLTRPGSQQPPVDREQYWPGTLMAFGVIVWLVSFWFIGTRTFIQISELLRWFTLFAFIGNVVPFRYSGLRLGMEKLEWFLFNLLAIGPFLFAFLLTINFFLHGEERVLLVPHGEGLDVVRYWRENGELPMHVPVEFPQQLQLAGTTDRVMVIARGSLGHDVLVQWHSARE